MRHPGEAGTWEGWQGCWAGWHFGSEDGNKKVTAMCFPAALGSYGVTDKMKDLGKNQALVICSIFIMLRARPGF